MNDFEKFLEGNNYKDDLEFQLCDLEMAFNAGKKLQWKPSDEQMHYLFWIANIKLGDGVVEQEVSKHLNELYNDLKKLREGYDRV